MNPKSGKIDMWVTGQRRTNEHTQMSRQRDRQTKNKQTNRQKLSYPVN